MTEDELKEIVAERLKQDKLDEIAWREDETSWDVQAQSILALCRDYYRGEERVRIKDILVEKNKATALDMIAHTTEKPNDRQGKMCRGIRQNVINELIGAILRPPCTLKEGK